ncbi:MAG TPA: hypothetical protein VJ123_02120 [Anaerolineales bacterium]|nr:hypothetical protein [Anaerolineales bacterium]
MHPPDYNLNLLQAMLESLESFLLSEQVFWTLSGRAPAGMPPYPSLSLGSLLLLVDELVAQETGMSQEQRRRWEQLRQEYEIARAQRLAGLGRRAAQELGTRINLWQAYLADLEDRPEAAEDFSREVANRLKSARLLSLARPSAEALQAESRLDALDRRLGSRFRRGEFVWDEALAHVYPADSYPYLYGRPRPVE